MSSIRFSLVSQAIDIASLAAELRDPAAGAVVTFDGRVRNHNAGQAVSRLEYQAYPALAISTGQRILEEEAARDDERGVRNRSFFLREKRVEVSSPLVSPLLRKC